MATDVTEITYPPIDSQATYTFIDTQLTAAQKTGKVQDDFKLALFTVLGLSGVNSDYSIDDLWKRYIINVIASDGNTKSGNPASAGRGHQGHVGQAMRQYYSKAHLNNPGNANAFPTGSLIQASQVKVLANFNGLDGATTWTAQKPAVAATLGGTNAIEHSIVKHGNASLQGLVNGYTTLPANTEFDIPAATDWTMEAWVRAPNFGNDNVPILSLENSFELGLDATGSYGGLKALIYESDNSTIDVDVTHTLLVGEITNNAFNHVAFTKSGTTLRGFIGGVEIFSTTVQNDGLGTSVGKPLRFGSGFQDTTVLDGYIDSVRLIVGTALYTEAFTPPIGQFHGGEAVELGAPMYCYYPSETWTDGGATYDLAALLVPFTTADQINGLDWNSDGTKLLITNTADDETYTYSLSVAYDFSTAVETGASDTTTNPTHGQWNASGTSYTVHEYAIDTFSQYTLSSPYVMEATPTLESNATEANLGVSGAHNAGFHWNADGTAIYARGNPGSVNTVSRTPLTGTAYDLDSLGTPVTANLDNPLKTTAAGEGCVWVDPTETYIYVSSIVYVIVGEMSTPGDLSTVTWLEDLARIYVVDNQQLVYVHPDGSYFLTINSKFATPKIYKWSHQDGANN